MTLILFFVILVWIKIIVGTAAIFFWLWYVRDRGWKGLRAVASWAVVCALWAAPWLALVWHETTLYTGRCGLRQGIHDCDMVEFVWSRLGWGQMGFILDAALFVAIIVLMARAHIRKGGAPGDATRMASP